MILKIRANPTYVNIKQKKRLMFILSKEFLFSVYEIPTSLGRCGRTTHDLLSHQNSKGYFQLYLSDRTYKKNGNHISNPIDAIC